jgi:hypothetical protein
MVDQIKKGVDLLKKTSQDVLGYVPIGAGFGVGLALASKVAKRFGFNN